MAESVPLQFFDQAWAFRDAIAAEQDSFNTALSRITHPLHSRFCARQTPSPQGLARAVNSWRNMPNYGRVAIETHVGRRHLELTEFRLLAGTFRFAQWPEGDRETSLILSRASLAVDPSKFRFDHVPIATVNTHGLGRRFERGRHDSDIAVKADLAMLCDVLTLPDDTVDFRTDCADGGGWVGTMTMIDWGGEERRIASVRTFIVGGMTPRRSAEAP